MPQNHSCNCTLKTHADPVSSTLWVLSRMDSATLPRVVYCKLNQPLKETEFNYTWLKAHSGDSRVCRRRKHIWSVMLKTILLSIYYTITWIIIYVYELLHPLLAITRHIYVYELLQTLLTKTRDIYPRLSIVTPTTNQTRNIYLRTWFVTSTTNQNTSYLIWVALFCVTDNASVLTHWADNGPVYLSSYCFFSDADVLPNSTFFQFLMKMAPTQQTQPNSII